MGKQPAAAAVANASRPPRPSRALSAAQRAAKRNGRAPVRAIYRAGYKVFAPKGKTVEGRWSRTREIIAVFLHRQDAWDYVSRRSPSAPPASIEPASQA